LTEWEEEEEEEEAAAAGEGRALLWDMRSECACAMTPGMFIEEAMGS
jgi:hypothetical protein